MKKILIALVGLVFILSIACVVSAAPFSDLPPDHWAYKAVNDLAKAGIVEGYGDGTFRGDRTMTRYQMAMIVANAMTKLDKADKQQKELIEKLANEFNIELEKIGARLSKVEEKTRINIHPLQQFFFSSASVKPGAGGAYGGGGFSNQNWVGERLRVFINVPDSENRFVLNALLQQYRGNFQRTVSDSSSASFIRYYVTANNTLGGTLELGKNSVYLGKGAFVGYTGNLDGVMYTNKSGILTTKLGVGNISQTSSGEFSFAQATIKPNKTQDIGAYIYKNKNTSKLFGIMGSTDIGNGMGLLFEATRNTATGYNKSGYIVALMSKATACDMEPTNNWTLANPKKLYDSGWGLSYRHLPDGVSGPGNIGSATSFTTILTDPDGKYPNTFDNVNAVSFDYYYVPYKNMLLTLEYSHITPINTSQTWVNNYLMGMVSFYF